MEKQRIEADLRNKLDVMKQSGFPGDVNKAVDELKADNHALALRLAGL